MKSGMMVIIGISMRPNQNTAVENSIMYIPAMTLPTGITGQKKLQKYEEVYIIKKLFLKSVFFFILRIMLTTSNFTNLYTITKMNHKIMDPQMAQWVGNVHEFVTRPAFKQTVTTTYCNMKNMCTLIYNLKVGYTNVDQLNIVNPWLNHDNTERLYAFLLLVLLMSAVSLAQDHCV